MFYVYVDWTTEVSPRSFYVGKGTFDRVKVHSRNELHNRIASKYGLLREIVVTTSSEWVALEIEKDMIREHRTYVHGQHYKGFGANFTAGGEGGSYGPVSILTLQKRSQSMKILHQDPVFKQKHAHGIAKSNLAPGVRERKSRAATLAANRPEAKERYVNSARQSWSDPVRKFARLEAGKEARKAYHDNRTRLMQERHAMILVLLSQNFTRLEIVEKLGVKIHDIYKASRLHKKNSRK